MKAKGLSGVKRPKPSRQSPWPYLGPLDMLAGGLQELWGFTVVRTVMSLGAELPEKPPLPGMISAFSPSTGDWTSLIPIFILRPYETGTHCLLFLF